MGLSEQDLTEIEAETALCDARAQRNIYALLTEVRELRAAVDRRMGENPAMVRAVIANEIGQTVIDGFISAGVALGDALYAGLQMARELPYERLKR